MAVRTIACALFLGATAAREDAYPTYGVEAGTTLVRTYTSTTELESEPASMFVDGEEVPKEGHGDLRLKVADKKEFEVADKIVSAAGGRPTQLEREYRAFSNRSTETVVATPPDGEAKEKATERERESPLKGRTVQFTWDAKSEEYTPKFVVAEGAEPPDADLLEGLICDADWLPLIADGPREKGATFELEAQMFERAQYPLGDLHWQVDGKDPDEVSKEINGELSENLAGKASATWQGVREEDGREVGVFALKAELTSKAEAETGENGETRAVDLEFEYAGEVLWDMKAGRLAGYTLEVDVRSVLSTTRAFESPKGKVALRQVFDLKGTAKHELTVSAD